MHYVEVESSARGRELRNILRGYFPKMCSDPEFDVEVKISVRGRKLGKTYFEVISKKCALTPNSGAAGIKKRRTSLSAVAT
jgi:hypothetical protein